MIYLQILGNDGCHNAEIDWRSLRSEEPKQSLMYGTCLRVNEAVYVSFNLRTRAPVITGGKHFSQLRPSVYLEVVSVPTTNAYG